MTGDLHKLFDANIRISNLDPLSDGAIWPHSIEVCITRIPIRKRDGYSLEKINQLTTKLKSHMVKNGIVFLICYAPIECKSRPYEIAKSMTDAGFRHIDNIIIKKSWYPGKRSEFTLVNSHEYVLYFCNGNVWKLDRVPLREYLHTPEDVSCPGNTWLIKTGSLEESYPLDLAELLLRMTDCLPGSIVFDPFCGTKSSLLAAMKLGHSFWAFEKDAKRFEKYQKLVQEFQVKGTINNGSK